MMKLLYGCKSRWLSLLRSFLLAYLYKEPLFALAISCVSLKSVNKWIADLRSEAMPRTYTEYLHEPVACFFLFLFWLLLLKSVVSLQFRPWQCMRALFFYQTVCQYFSWNIYENSWSEHTRMSAEGYPVFIVINDQNSILFTKETAL